ncbi:MAG: hypothetical protein WBO12_20900, partial [Xanthobacteraceae bacterium]
AKGFYVEANAHFRFWPIASFRQDAEFDRYRGIADMARLAVGSTRSRMTHSGHEAGPLRCNERHNSQSKM